MEGMLTFVEKRGKLAWLEDSQLDSGEFREDWRRRVIRGNFGKLEFAGVMELGDRGD